MTERRIVSLLLCISFALSAATGILFMPFIRFKLGIANESLWRMVHFYSTMAMASLICEHVVLNRKALGNYLRTSRISSLFAYILATIILVGVIYFGVSGGDLGITAPWYELDLYRARSASLPTRISFPENFEDGKADGWRLGPGWEVKLENGNYVLSGLSDKWSSAYPIVSGWFNYTLEARVKLNSGQFHVNIRTSEVPFRSRYTLGLGEKDFYLNRGINERNLNLKGGQPILKFNEWHQLKIVLNGTNIKVYLDDEPKLDYTDSDLALIFGGFTFDIAPNSQAFFDDINVSVGELTQMTPKPTKPTPTPK